MVLPNSMRIKGIKCFDHLHRRGERFYGPLMTLRVAKAQNKLLKGTANAQKASYRCAVTISSKVSKKAVIRNRLRRLIHDHLRQRFEHAHSFSDQWALISLKPTAVKAEKGPLLKECDNLLHKAGFI